MMKSFEEALKDSIIGEIHFDLPSRMIYSVDASIYEVKPLGIVLPKSTEDLTTILKIAASYNIPVIPRGAATGITGGCLGTGLIIDTSKHLNKIIEINFDEEYAVCEPGVVQDQLNEALKSHGYRLGPDTSTGNRATLGGMLANNSAGARSLKYGTMADHVIGVELALAGGETIYLSPLGKGALQGKLRKEDREGQIYREIESVISDHRQDILDHFPRIPRHVSGYNLDKLIDSHEINLCALIAGSEGTLGIATKIKVRIAKIPMITALCILPVDYMISGMKHIPAMLEHFPLSLEMIDDKILLAAKDSPTVRGKLGWLQGLPQAVFVAEFEAESDSGLKAKVESFVSEMQTKGFTNGAVTLFQQKEKDDVWQVRKAGLGLLLSKRSYTRAIAFIEDLSLPPEHLADFMQEFTDYLKKMGKDAGIYGHIGSGCMHIRPYIDLRNAQENLLMKTMMDDVSTMVLKHGGALSGEHGDGLIRSWLNEKMFGKELYQAFKRIKHTFDPHNLMNPGKIVDGPPLLENLRLSPESKEVKLKTFLDFSAEGGLELAADLCNGNGECRKKEGVMCPSFQASGDEYHTTRARAQTLRSIIHGKLPGKLPVEDYTGKAMYDVLDLCIECKGCKKECPSSVDMAKMKSEFLYQYQEKHGYSLRNRLFGMLPKLNTFASPIAGVVNALSSLKVVQALLSLFGITPKRTLPKLAKERFSEWFGKQDQISTEKKVILFNDTYTEYNEPDIGKAAFRLLKALGYTVILGRSGCCGRPMISKGLLKEAKDNAREMIGRIATAMNETTSMVVLEPSCLSAFRDDYKGLLGNNEQLKRVASQTWSLDEFLQQHLVDRKLPLSFKKTEKHIWVHGHCHQKSLIGTAPTLDVLHGTAGFIVHEIVSGCCGMAGSFGYEKEHYDFSMKIGELHLFPQVRKTSSDDVIIASGFSCRSQIEHGTDREGIHLACAIAEHLED